MKEVWVLSVLLCVCHAETSVDVVSGLIERLIPQHASSFDLIEIESEGFGVFEIDTTPDGKIALRGSSGIEIASALNWYLKDYCQAIVSWTGDQLDLPTPLPLPEFRRTLRTMEWSYYQNTCTGSYSFAFYDWSKWEREIDWMALNGINMPLAFNGQEYVFQLTYNEFGIPPEALQDFFAGPAFQTWQRMGNIYGWGGTASQGFIEDQMMLQKRILERMRSFGMKPILTAFSGLVPNAFLQRYPEARVTESGWKGDWDSTWFLESSDPMFNEIASTFIRIQADVYGTDHLYNTDSFNENTPPTNDPEFLRSSAAAVYGGMADGDPDAVWIMQGWLFHYEADFWELPQIEGLLSGVPDDRMIILDLFAESYPVWQRVQSFFGKKFIWCMLHNFGGVLGMYGRMQIIKEEPLKAYYDENSTMAGIGLTMEGTRQNYIVYDLMLEMSYRTEPVNLDFWVSGENGWIDRRYGHMKDVETRQKLAQAWSILAEGILSGPIVAFYRSPLALSPVLDDVKAERFRQLQEEVFGEFRRTVPKYRNDILRVWEIFVSMLENESSEIIHTQTFQHDLVDITRQAISEIFKDIHKNLSSSYLSRDLEKMTLWGQWMIDILIDLDELLRSNQFFLLGQWLQDARSIARPEDRNLFEFNARNQVTLWGPTLTLNDYASKEWGGLVGDYFCERYYRFISAISQAVITGNTFDQKEFNEEMLEFGLAWARETDPNGTRYPPTPQGDTSQIAGRLYEKYHQLNLE